MPDIRFKIPPHKQQVKFMNCAHKEQLFGGAKRGGKSVAICQKVIALSMAFPGNRGILIRQNLTDLKDSTLVTFFQVCPKEIIARHHLGDRMITFTNGSYFIYRGVGDEDELEKVKGIDLGWLAVDEPSEIELATYLMLLAQMNWKLPDGKRPAYMALLACNPEPGWVKERFIDPDHLPPDRIFITSLAKDNPGLPTDYIAYLLANFPKEWVEKYVNGSWEISEGMVYKEWDRDIHVISSMPSLSTCKLFGSLDPAPATITCNIHMAIDPYFNHYIFWEYYRSERLLSHHAADIKDQLAKYHANHGLTLEYMLIDPASQQRSNLPNRDAMVSTQELYSEEGIHCIPAWNVLEAGIERVKRLLHVDPHHIHPLTGQLGSPHLFVLEQCVNTIAEFPNWKRKLESNGNIRYTGKDHALDNIRYIVNSRPVPPDLTDRDEMAQSSFSRQVRRSHASWASKFDAAIRKQNGEGQGYFDYFNQTPQ